ncbi:multicopper oxidase family protein [Streptomyces sp. NPDC007264]|uniref:multicopper oxidase family protein n=1 Tax=Streptomyces sp. NPDC007264 TaxID=3364777 RepID=UPI0036DF1D6A
MAVDRRQILRGAIAGAATAAPFRLGETAAHAPSAPVGAFDDPLARPALVDGGSPVHLTIENTTHRFGSSLKAAPTLAYRLTEGEVVVPGTISGYLGPTIVVRTGTPAAVSVTHHVTRHPLAASVDTAVHGAVTGDRTRPRTAVHLHGANSRPRHDGGPLDTFPSGTAGEPPFPNPTTYRYENTQDATALWYHDHALGITRLNVYAGLAACYLIRDTEDTGIDTGDGTMLPAGPHEIPLVLQDKSFTADGEQYFPPAPWAPEFFGDTPVVNGVARPYLTVDRGVYRFRLVNASNARFYRLGITVQGTGAALPFWQIGGDGGLLNSPVRTEQLLIAPAERADLLVDFRGLAAGTVLEVGNSAAAPYPAGSPNAPALRQIMRFRVTARTGWAPRRPLAGMRLRPLTPVRRLDRAATSAPVRTHSLVEITDPGTGDVLMVLQNNRSFHDTAYASHPVTPDTLEVWEFANTTPDTHPIHVHLVQFQVLGRQPFDARRYRRDVYADASGRVLPGSGPYPPPSPRGHLTGPLQPPAANETGWKDTVQVPPGMVTRIAVPFGCGAAPFPIAAREVHSGDYVWHCHIVDHEDHDMMQRFRIA